MLFWRSMDTIWWHFVLGVWWFNAFAPRVIVCGQGVGIYLDEQTRTLTFQPTVHSFCHVVHPARNIFDSSSSKPHKAAVRRLFHRTSTTAFCRSVLKVERRRYPSTPVYKIPAEEISAAYKLHAADEKKVPRRMLTSKPASRGPRRFLHTTQRFFKGKKRKKKKERKKRAGAEEKRPGHWPIVSHCAETRTRLGTRVRRGKREKQMASFMARRARGHGSLRLARLADTASFLGGSFAARLVCT